MAEEPPALYVLSGVAWVSGAAGRGAAYPWGPLPGVHTGNARPLEYEK